jgi:hypothetical protein
MHDIGKALEAVRKRIAAAERRFGRAAGDVQLLAASKAQTSAAIREAAANGQHAFGENYLQEALAKIDALADLDLEWHFIGPVQSNKTRDIARAFCWVHGIERLKIARRLSDQRDPLRPPLNVCIQVNLSGETSKSGVAPGQVRELALAISELPRLALRGLMTIPHPAEEWEAQREPFRALRLLLQDLNTQGISLDTLSMGMSQDLEAAIAEGATIVRVGTAIFGERRPAD